MFENYTCDQNAKYIQSIFFYFCILQEMGMDMENIAKDEDTSSVEVRRKNHSILYEINEYPGM